MKPWYLLYGGTSEDGAGPGVYKGRTDDIEAAVKHFRYINENPYSVGYVAIVTDNKVLHASSEDEIRRA